jgi:hypothetical protein
MMFWLFFGCWWGYSAYPGKPFAMGTTIIPWLCVLILGLIVFGGINPGPINIR